MDMEKVIKAYECCGNPFNRKCEKCPYEKDCCHDGIPMFVIRKMVELLKEKEAIIRCKDCKKHGDIACPLWTDAVEWETDDDWFCADGERKDT